MARLDSIRDSLIEDQSEPHQVVVMATDHDEKVEWTFDDDDFWNALDLMETSVKTLEALLRDHQFSSGLQLLIENHINDLKFFVGEFLVEDPS